MTRKSEAVLVGVLVACGAGALLAQPAQWPATSAAPSRAASPSTIEAPIVIAADVAGETLLCVDAARTRCVTVSAVRDMAVAPGEESPLERVLRENVDLQQQIAVLLARASDLEAQLGPLRATEHRLALEAQRDRLKADAERREPGYTYDPRTGKRTKRTESK